MTSLESIYETSAVVHAVSTVIVAPADATHGTNEELAAALTKQANADSNQDELRARELFDLITLLASRFEDELK